MVAFFGRNFPASVQASQMDVFSKEERSRIMRSVRSKGTGPENCCRQLLRSLKLRFRSQSAGLPGRPDFILYDYKVALFVHGCFWHGHRDCKGAQLPATNASYWLRKIENNSRRDQRARRALRKMGWRTVVFWECQLKNVDLVARRLLKLATGRCIRKKLR